MQMTQTSLKCHAVLRLTEISAKCPHDSRDHSVEIQIPTAGRRKFSNVKQIISANAIIMFYYEECEMYGDPYAHVVRKSHHYQTSSTKSSRKNKYIRSCRRQHTLGLPDRRCNTVNLLTVRIHLRDRWMAISYTAITNSSSFVHRNSK